MNTELLLLKSEITAERINIVEKNGDLKMVISNSALQHPGRMMNG